MDNNEKWLRINVLLQYVQRHWLRKLLRDLRNLFQLRCSILLLSGAVICRQALLGHFDGKMRVSRKTIS